MIPKCFSQMFCQIPQLTLPHITNAHRPLSNESNRPFNGQCHTCNEYGHRAAECNLGIDRAPRRGGGRPAVTRRHEPQQSLSSFGGRCRTCSKYGHRAADCDEGESAGAFSFVCECGNKFSGVCRGFHGSAPCYKCGKNTRPAERLPKGLGTRKTANVHSCDLCKGHGECPVFASMSGGRRARRN